MAQTFIGRLIMGYRDEAGPGAKRTAAQINAAMRSIESTGQRMARASWGVGFQKQVDRLGLSSAEIARMTGSWNELNASIRSNNLNKALARSEISGWKAATISHFAQVRASAVRDFDAIERRAKSVNSFTQAIGRSALVAGGAYTGVYAGGMMARAGLLSGSNRQREQFRQRMAGISPEEQAIIKKRADDLALEFPSVGTTEIMEMGRVATAMMGDVERGTAVLKEMTQALVVLQATKGPDAAVDTLNKMILAFDNLGVNSEGAEGISRVRSLTEAIVKATQSDSDFDPASFLSFARRAKVAGPALSDGFLSRAFAYIQDGGSDTTGNQLAMGMKAFLLEAVGSAGGAKYLAERERLGLRETKADGTRGLVGSDLFATDPDKWAMQYLVPALEKAGIDLANDAAVTEAVARLSGNTNATGFLTRLITQHEQTSRAIERQNEAMGLSAAAEASYENAHQAAKALANSLGELSAAVLPMSFISKSLTDMAKSIKSFSRGLENNPDLQKLLGWGAVGGAGAATVLAGRGIYGLITAGTNLNVAAVALQRAAAMQAGVGTLEGPGGNGKPKGGSKAILKALGLTGLLGGTTILTQSLGDTPGDTFEDQVKNQKDFRLFLLELFPVLQRLPGVNLDGLSEFPSVGPSSRRGGTLPIPADRPVVEEIADAVINAVLPEIRSRPSPTHPDMDRPAEHRAPGQSAGSGAYGGNDGLGVPTSPFDVSRAEAEAAQAGARIEQALSVTGQASVAVDTSAIEYAISRAQALLNLLQSAGREGAAAKARVNAEVNRTFADFGGP